MKERTFWRIASFATGLLIAGILLLALGADFADAHEAPSGWAYPYACCSNKDCREVSSGPDGLVRERPEGYLIATTGEVLAYSDRRVKQSRDGVYHWCSIAGADDGRTICLFVPPKAF